MADGSVEVDITGNTSDFDKAVDGLTDKVSSGTIALGNVLADLAKKAISSLAGAVSDALDTGMTFEKSMSNVTALQQAAGATADDIALLKQAAEDYGASTQFTMAQCSDALGYMALAGWDAQKSVEALPGVLSLAASSGMELAAASDMVTDYMSAFSKSVSDLSGEALTAAEFSDKLAYAQANSNTTAAMLGEAFKNCAANMNAAGQQMDSVTAILGAMANQGLKGSEAGTQLSAIMRDITNSMEDGAISINGTSIAVADASGNYRDMIDIMADIEAATNGMGETERATALSAVFTAHSVNGLNLVLNAGTASVRELEAGLSDCEGAAEEMAATMNDNLAGDLTFMDSALDAVKNSIYEGINPALRSLVQMVTNDVAPNLTLLVNGLLGAASGVTSAGSQIRASVSALEDVLKNTILDVLQRLPDAFKAGLDFKDAFLNAIADLLPAVLPALTDAIYKMARYLIAGIPMMVQAATDLMEGLTDAILSIDFAGMLTDLIGILVSRLQYSIPMLQEAATDLFSSITDALPTMLEGGQQIMDALLGTITELIPVLIPIGMQMLEAIISGLMSAMPQLLESAQMLLISLVGFIQENLPLLITAALGLLNVLVQMLIENLPLLVGFVQELLTYLVGFIQENLPLLITAALDLLNALTQMLIENLPLLVSVAIDLLLILSQAIVDSCPLLLNAALQLILGLCQYLTDNLDLVIDAAFEIMDALILGIVDLIPMLLDCAIELIKQLCEFLMDDENRGTIIECAESVLQALIDGIEASMELVWTALGELWDALVEWFQNTDWMELGEHILNGIAAGMSTAVVAIGDTISDIGERIKDGFKSFFGIQSPSKLMRDEIGKFLLPGVTVGMEDTSAQAAYDMNKALDDAASRINTEALSMQINAAMQLHGVSAAPTDFAQNIGISGNSGSTESLTDNETPPINLSPVFYVQIGNEELRGFVVSVIDQENVITGGNTF